ncbi:MAG: DUF3473 domain-containing protein [Acidobacteriota bacterium]|nr:DUF3473 domain-containing protein [Acidobacteriota bacterium]
MLNAFTIDVEDYFHTEAMSAAVPANKWAGMELRVERNTWKLLELLERRGVKATLFFLGWVAERCPQLVQAAAAAGHEVGCHSYSHRPVYRLTPQEFREDTRRAKDVLETIAGHRVRGYRAPSFSILQNMEWARHILVEEGFIYSSSSHPIRHANYGDRLGMRLPYRDSNGLWEFPMTTWRVLGQNLPVSGGAYLRILPASYTALGLRRAAAAGEPLMVYLHPWEIDENQPRLNAGWRSCLRQYTGLQGMLGRVESLLERYAFGTVARAYRVAERSSWNQKSTAMGSAIL